MKTLEDFKNEVAKENGFKDWDYLFMSFPGMIGLGRFQDEAAIRFAKYIQEETIKRCAEREVVLKQFLYDKITERRQYSSSKSFEVVLEEIERFPILNVERILE